MLFTEITLILRIHVRFRAKVKQFSQPHTGSETHPAYRPVNGVGSFLADATAEEQSWSLTYT
jgi:hypothetical protein